MFKISLPRIHTESTGSSMSVAMSFQQELKDNGLDLPDEQLNVVVSFLRSEAFDCMEDLAGTPVLWVALHRQYAALQGRAMLSRCITHGC